MLDNYAIADHFTLLAKLMDIHGENSFKAKSYATAAFSIEKLPIQLSDTPREKIATLKGIGDSSARKIIELLDTGKLTLLDELVAQTPPGILEMMQIKGLGPKKIATIWKDMGIETLGELLYACNENRLLLYKGFGQKTQESVRQAIQFYLSHKGQHLYSEVETFAQELETRFKLAFPNQQSSLSGQVKRQSAIVTQLELLTTVSFPDINRFLTETAFEDIQQTENSIRAQSPSGTKLTFTVCTAEEFVPKLFESTCSEPFLQAFSATTGYTASQHYPTESSIFETANLAFVPANLRERAEVVTEAQTGALPALVQVEDIKGIIHTHSQWSDGLTSIAQMAQACIDKGFEYLVISDHSKSAGYANGLQPDRIIQQHAEIDELNSELAPFRIFKSIECDILADGSLDYDDTVLNSFDLVIASIHSNLKMTQEKAMDRLLKAIQHPATRILGHMTGRLLLSRPGYPIDHHVIIDACAANGVVIEINAHPRRLDLDWSWIPYAMEKGCLLSIDPDAHSIEGYDDIRYGVLAAQKGGLTPMRNLSSFDLETFTKWMMEKPHKI